MYYEALSADTQIETQSLIGLFLLPFRGARTFFNARHRLLRFEGTRRLIYKTLKQINRPIRNTALLRRFDWFKVFGFLLGETVFTFVVSIISFILLLLLAGFWAYISQEHLNKFGLIFSYLPLEHIFDGFKSYPVINDTCEFYVTNIKPLLSNPAKELAKWEIFKNFVLDFSILALFKISITTLHEWPIFISTFIDECLPYLYFNEKMKSIGVIIGFYSCVLQLYFIEPTLALIKSILLIPFKGLTPLIATNWVGEIVWALSAYYSKFQELYWKYIWDYEYVAKPIQWLKEYKYINNEAVYTGKQYRVDDLWVSVTDGDEAAKLVDGDALEDKKAKHGASSKTVGAKDEALLSKASSLVSHPVEAVETGRISPVEEQAQTIQSEWSGDETPRAKGKQIEPASPDSVETDSSLASTESGKERQHSRFFKPADVKTTPIYVSEQPNPNSYLINPVLTGSGVIKNGQVMYYERTTPIINNWVSEGGPNVYRIQPDREHEICGEVSWKWFLMTNPKVISLLCFSSTLLASLAIKSVIKLSVDTAILVMSS